MTMTRKQAVDFLQNHPVELAHKLGFTKLTKLHEKWIKNMAFGRGNYTLQAHRGSYKTTCVSIALALIIVLKPRRTILFLRKTDTDVIEIIKQVKKILMSQQIQYFVKCIYGTELFFTKATEKELSTNLCSSEVKGTSQLLGMGIFSSITGKHFDYIFTDDIINVEDRYSPAEREKTKRAYMELENILNRDDYCREFNTGTPWHKNDAFQLMPEPEVWDCYSTGLMTEEDIERKKEKMTSSLFAANYELKHIADSDVIFPDPQTGAAAYLAEQGIGHIDAAYGGEDYSAYTAGCYRNGKYYLLGKLRHMHIDDCIDEFLKIHKDMNEGKLYLENNGDKGYLRKDIKRNRGFKQVIDYHEDMNKVKKITSYLKIEWKNVIFVEGTDPEYIDMITDFNENAEHDDAPDSAASLIRQLWKKAGKKEEEWHSEWMLK